VDLLLHKEHLFSDMFRDRLVDVLESRRRDGTIDSTCW